MIVVGEDEVKGVQQHKAYVRVDAASQISEMAPR